MTPKLDHPLRVALDIGGVMSKYPDVIRAFARALLDGGALIYVITDMPRHDEVMQMLATNDFGFIQAEYVHCADYKAYGEGCKAELLAALEIDLVLDDCLGYMAIPGRTVRCLVMPDATQPYWHPTWDAGLANSIDFGRRVYRKP